MKLIDLAHSRLHFCDTDIYCESREILIPQSLHAYGISHIAKLSTL